MVLKHMPEKTSERYTVIDIGRGLDLQDRKKAHSKSDQRQARVYLVSMNFMDSENPLQVLR
jgi:hypothetical protein